MNAVESITGIAQTLFYEVYVPQRQDLIVTGQVLFDQPSDGVQKKDKSKDNQEVE